jgi:hypothetical protein
MSLYVQVIEGDVVKVWDTAPPEGEADWHEAIEIIPEIVKDRQVIEGHTFDLTSNPVQIIYLLRDITIEERKDTLINQAKNAFKIIVNEQMLIEMSETDISGDLNIVSAAKSAKDARIAMINACVTHDELDNLA